ncbi:MAG: 50S ribosomal protein L6 [Candidatus Ranarchaeia archaeon]
MGRIPYKEERLEIPEDIKVEISGKIVSVEGQKGNMTKDFSHAPVEMKKENKEITLSVTNARRKQIAILGTITSHINNMFIGVTKGFRYSMKIVYAHFPIQIALEKKNLLIKNFGGEKAPRIAKILGSVEVKITKDDIILEGIDIDEVSQSAANIRRKTKIKNKDPRVFQDGIYVYKKGVIEDA